MLDIYGMKQSIHIRYLWIEAIYKHWISMDRNTLNIGYVCSEAVYKYYISMIKAVFKC